MKCPKCGERMKLVSTELSHSFTVSGENITILTKEWEHKSCRFKPEQKVKLE